MPVSPSPIEYWNHPIYSSRIGRFERFSRAEINIQTLGETDFIRALINCENCKKRIAGYCQSPQNQFIDAIEIDKCGQDEI